MASGEGAEPVENDEVLYRRVPLSQEWFAPEEGTLSPEAFKPTKYDATGLSLGRAKYQTPEEEGGRGRKGRSYYVAFLRAGDLRASGIEVEPRPLPGNPGHCEIPGLNFDNRRSPESQEMKARLAQKLCFKVEGPFEGLRED